MACDVAGIRGSRCLSLEGEQHKSSSVTEQPFQVPSDWLHMRELLGCSGWPIV